MKYFLAQETLFQNMVSRDELILKQVFGENLFKNKLSEGAIFRGYSVVEHRL